MSEQARRRCCPIHVRVRRGVEAGLTTRVCILHPGIGTFGSCYNPSFNEKTITKEVRVSQTRYRENRRVLLGGGKCDLTRDVACSCIWSRVHPTLMLLSDGSKHRYYAIYHVHISLSTIIKYQKIFYIIGLFPTTAPRLQTYLDQTPQVPTNIGNGYPS